MALSPTHGDLPLVINMSQKWDFRPALASPELGRRGGSQD